jgi:hypothetical protein
MAGDGRFIEGASRGAFGESHGDTASRAERRTRIGPRHRRDAQILKRSMAAILLAIVPVATAASVPERSCGFLGRVIELSSLADGDEILRLEAVEGDCDAETFRVDGSVMPARARIGRGAEPPRAGQCVAGGAVLHADASIPVISEIEPAPCP